MINFTRSKSLYTLIAFFIYFNAQSREIVSSEMSCPGFSAIIVSQNNISCNGGSDGSITADGSGGTIPYTFLWSTGATNATINGLTAGTYSVTVTDNAGCTASASRQLFQPAAPVGVTIFSQTNVSCNGFADGSATASGSGGNAVFTYSWNTGATTATVDNLSAGTYTVSVTDGNNCGPAVTSVTITEPAVLAATIANQVNISCNGGDDGSLTASAIGGTSPYSFNWNSATGPTINMAQSFESVVTDNWNYTLNPASYNTEGDSAVSGSEDVWAVIQEFTGDIGAASEGALFFGGQDLNNSNGGGSFYHTIDFDAIDLSSASGNVTVTFDYYSDGYDNSDSVEYQVKYDNGATWDANGVVLNKNTQAWTTVTINVPGGSSFVRLRLQAKQDGSSDHVGFDNVTLTESGGPSMPTISNLSVGTYTVTVTDQNSCTSSISATITEPDIIRDTTTTTACDSFTWMSNGATYTMSGIYSDTLVGGSANGCDSISNLDLTINNTARDTTTTTACDSFTWMSNGATYTTSGIYSDTLVGGSANGCDSISNLDLTITNTIRDTTAMSACGSFTWTSNGATYTMSGIYSDTLVGGSANGCDSISNLDLTITNTIRDTTAMSACGSFTWTSNGATYTMSGIYSDTLVGGSVNGCDSISNLDLTINNTSRDTTAMSACGSFTWMSNGATYTMSGIYSDTLVGGSANGCDSISNLDLTINNTARDTTAMSACGSFTWMSNGATYTTSGIYSDTLVGGSANGCDSISNLDLTINNTARDTTVMSACGSITWMSNGATYTMSGIYSDTLVGGSANGCDSISNLDLTINNTARDTTAMSACGSFTWTSNGATYTTSGIYSDTLVGGSANGCDSISNLDLTINDTARDTTAMSACGSFTWMSNGATYTTSGIYSDTLVGGSANGCDSISNLDLTINNTARDTTAMSACGSFTWMSNGATYTTSGIYSDTLVGGSANGCDSISNLELTINDTARDTTAMSACGSFTWTSNGTTYTTSGIYSDTLVGGSANGCDSISNLDLTITNTIRDTTAMSACGSFTWTSNGATYTMSGIYSDTLVGGSANGCDSISNLDLTITNTIRDTTAMSACGSFTWMSNGATYTMSGIYSDTLVGGSTNGCDSISNLDLTINDTARDTTAMSACGSFTWMSNGATYTTSGIYSDTLVGGSANGCDSISNLDLTINNGTTGTDVQSACGSYTWIDGMTYTSSNNTAMFTIVGGSANGCDSVVTLDLTINKATTGTDVQSACGSYTWIDGMTYTASNNTAMFTIVGGSANGCDSVVTLDLTINNPATGTDVQSACGSYTWIDGMTYTSSNNTAMFTIVGGSSNGCDSVVTLDLTINNSTTGTDVQSACGSYTWIDGMTYTASNTTAMFTIVGGSANGCDSVVTLDLTINNSTTGTDVQSACGSYTWIDGMTYTASNNTAMFTIVGGSANGCDSVVTLDLTINNSTTGTDVQSACGSYTWIDGMTYTSSNNTAMFTIVGGSANGCDSVVTLDLTINNPTTGTDVQTACDFYNWIDGNVYIASTNTPTFTIVGGAANGCDSVVTLDLTINNSSTSTDVQSACGSYTWIDGITYTSSNNSAMFTISGGAANGCDSIINLDLTITNTIRDTSVVSVCGSYTWINNGVTYNTSGIYSDTIIGGSANGCDSISNLDLTIINQPMDTTTMVACNSFTWANNGITYTIGGLYSDTIFGGASNGCDSINFLDLTINGNNLTVIRTGFDLTALQNGVSYQWIDCLNGDTAITGATSQTYSVAVNGQYAVIITSNNCTDTSACISVTNVSIGENELNNEEINIYPNPTRNSITLKLEKMPVNNVVRIYNLTGKEVRNVVITNRQQLIDISELEVGIYYVQVDSTITKIVKTK